MKRKYSAAIRQSPALGKREVLDAIERLGESRLTIRDKAVLWVATDSWRRASDNCACRVNDLCRQEDRTSLLFVSRFKTDPYRRGSYAFLSERRMRAVLKWIVVAELKPHHPMLTKSQKDAKTGPLNPATISRVSKR